MSQIILKRIDLNYSSFDTGEVNFKCVVPEILKGACKKVTPSFDFVLLLCRVKDVTSSGPISEIKIETTLAKLMKLIKVS